MSISTEDANGYDEDGNAKGPDIKALRRAADENPSLKRENADLKRQLAFVKAGIPTDDPKMNYFIKGYDGDLEPEAIRTAAVDAGFLAPETPPVDPQVQQAQAGQQRVMQASSGTDPQAGPAGAFYGLDQAYREGGMGAVAAYAQQNGIRIAND